MPGDLEVFLRDWVGYFYLIDTERTLPRRAKRCRPLRGTLRKRDVCLGWYFVCVD